MTDTQKVAIKLANVLVTAALAGRFGPFGDAIAAIAIRLAGAAERGAPLGAPLRLLSLALRCGHFLSETDLKVARELLVASWLAYGGRVKWVGYHLDWVLDIWYGTEDPEDSRPAYESIWPEESALAITPDYVDGLHAALSLARR